MSWIDCEECNGTGEVEVPIGMALADDPEADVDWETCEECHGEGRIEREYEE